NPGKKKKRRKFQLLAAAAACARCSHTSQSLSLCHPEARFWPKDPYTLYSLKNVPGNFSLYSQPLRIIEAEPSPAASCLVGVGAGALDTLRGLLRVVGWRRTRRWLEWSTQWPRLLNSVRPYTGSA